MSVTYGFYNSLNGDRAYDAVDISNMFTGIIADGVLATVGDGLIIHEHIGMDVKASSGRAWFNGTWTYNDADLPLTIADSDLVLDRIDLVILEVNTDISVRANSIKVLTGTPASTPVADELIKTETLNQYPLAEIYIAAGVTEIIQANITNKIGSVDCPFVTGLIDTIDADALLLQWDSEFNSWMESEQTDFDAWFANLQDILDENVAATLLLMIEQNEDDIEAIELKTDLISVTQAVNLDIMPKILEGTDSIPTTGWVANTGDYALKNDITITGILATDWIDIVIDKDSHDIAGDAEICPTVTEGIDIVTIYCNTAPAEAIPFKWKVVR